MSANAIKIWIKHKSKHNVFKKEERMDPNIILKDYIHKAFLVEHRHLRVR